MRPQDSTEALKHITHAARDVAELGIKPEHIAAYMVGHAIHLFKEQGFSNEEVMDRVKSGLKGYKD
jgi:hypothetical protein